jgi:hypothetical protein
VEGPRERRWTPGRLFAVGLVVLVGAFVAGYAVSSTDDDPAPVDRAEAASAPATTVAEPDAPELPSTPDPFGVRPIALLTFTTTATEAQIDRIRDEWEANDDLDGVMVLDEGDLASVDVRAITATVRDADRAAAEQFVCGYQDHPAVAAAGVDDLCPGSEEVPDLSELADDPDALIDDSGASLDEVELSVGFSSDAPPADIQPIRRRLERSGVFTTFEFEPRQSEFDGASIRATGSSDDVEAICTLGIEALAEFPVVDVVQLFGSNACPVL